MQRLCRNVLQNPCMGFRLTHQPWLLPVSYPASSMSSKATGIDRMNTGKSNTTDAEKQLEPSAKLQEKVNFPLENPPVTFTTKNPVILSAWKTLGDKISQAEANAELSQMFKKLDNLKARSHVLTSIINVQKQGLLRSRQPNQAVENNVFPVEMLSIMQETRPGNSFVPCKSFSTEGPSSTYKHIPPPPPPPLPPRNPRKKRKQKKTRNYLRIFFKGLAFGAAAAFAYYEVDKVVPELFPCIQRCSQHIINASEESCGCPDFIKNVDDTHVCVRDCFAKNPVPWDELFPVKAVKEPVIELKDPPPEIRLIEIAKRKKAPPPPPPPVEEEPEETAEEEEAEAVEGEEGEGQGEEGEGQGEEGEGQGEGEEGEEGKEGEEKEGSEKGEGAEGDEPVAAAVDEEQSTQEEPLPDEDTPAEMIAAIPIGAGSAMLLEEDESYKKIHAFMSAVEQLHFRSGHGLKSNAHTIWTVPEQDNIFDVEDNIKETATKHDNVSDDTVQKSLHVEDDKEELSTENHDRDQTSRHVEDDTEKLSTKNHDRDQTSLHVEDDKAELSTENKDDVTDDIIQKSCNVEENKEELCTKNDNDVTDDTILHVEDNVDKVSTKNDTDVKDDTVEKLLHVEAMAEEISAKNHDEVTDGTVQKLHSVEEDIKEAFTNQNVEDTPTKRDNDITNDTDQNLLCAEEADMFSEIVSQEYLKMSDDESILNKSAAAVAPIKEVAEEIAANIEASLESGDQAVHEPLTIPDYTNEEKNHANKVIDPTMNTNKVEEIKLVSNSKISLSTDQPGQDFASELRDGPATTDEEAEAELQQKVKRMFGFIGGMGLGVGAAILFQLSR